MFNNKKDPLADAAAKVMAENELRRQVEKKVNENFGVVAKKALPHERHAEYDAALAKATEIALKEGVEVLNEEKEDDKEEKKGREKAEKALGYKRKNEKTEKTPTGVKRSWTLTKEEAEQVQEGLMKKLKGALGLRRRKAAKMANTEDNLMADYGRMRLYYDTSPVGKQDSAGNKEATRQYNIAKRNKRRLSKVAAGKKPFQEQVEQLDELHGKGSLEKISSHWEKRRQAKENKLNRMIWAKKRGNKPQEYSDEDNRIRKLSDAKVNRADALIAHRDEPKNYKKKAKVLRRRAKAYMEETSFESVQEEIRNNLQKQLVEAYGNEEKFNAFVDNLTEEQIEILGIKSDE